jgi:tyrosine-protein kinase Etk/Wzc
MLSSQRLGWLLDELSRRFDLVIVDTPPILAVSDSLSVARLAGLTFLVLRAGQHPHREIALAVKQFALNGIRLHGAVLNDVRTTRGRYGRYGRYTQYQLPPDPPRPRRAR